MRFLRKNSFAKQKNQKAFQIMKGFFYWVIKKAYFYKKMNVIQLYIMGIIYIVLGVFHFTSPEFYKPLMPKFLPAHAALIFWSGIAEIVLGAAVFFPATKNLALWGIIAMLAVFLIVHINMLFPGNQLGMPIWALWLRIALQFLLIYWAYSNIN